jgi:hypothetical protein
MVNRIFHARPKSLSGAQEFLRILLIELKDGLEGGYFCPFNCFAASEHFFTSSSVLAGAGSASAF